MVTRQWRQRSHGVWVRSAPLRRRGPNRTITAEGTSAVHSLSASVKPICTCGLSWVQGSGRRRRAQMRPPRALHCARPHGEAPGEGSHRRTSCLSRHLTHQVGREPAQLPPLRQTLRASPQSPVPSPRQRPAASSRSSQTDDATNAAAAEPSRARHRGAGAAAAGHRVAFTRQTSHWKGFVYGRRTPSSSHTHGELQALLLPCCPPPPDESGRSVRSGS